MFEEVDVKSCGVNAGAFLVMESNDERKEEELGLRFSFSVVDCIGKFGVSVTDEIESIAKLFDSTSFVFDVAERHKFAQRNGDSLKFLKFRIVLEFSVRKNGGEFENEYVENALYGDVKFEVDEVGNFEFDIVGDSEGVASEAVNFERFFGETGESIIEFTLKSRNEINLDIRRLIF